MTRRAIIAGLVGAAVWLAGGSARATDVSMLSGLAAAIPNRDKQARQYALAQAAATVSQENEIRQLRTDVDELKAIVATLVPQP